VLALLLAAAVACVGFAGAADDPPPGEGDAPVRLKKKPRRPGEEKPADDKKPGDKGKDGDDKPADDKKPGDKNKTKGKGGDEPPAPGLPEEDEREVLDRVSRNLKTVGDRLANQELGEGTRQLQDDVLRDIESLIRRSESPPQGGGAGQDQDQQDQDQGGAQSKGGASGQGGQPKGSTGQGKQGRGQKSQGKGGAQAGGQLGGGNQPGGLRRPGGQKQTARGNRRGGRGDRLARGGQQPSGQQPGQEPGGEDGKGQNGGKGGGKTPPGVPDRNADLDKRDVWGHLPESLRAQMNAYASQREFMAKHEALIRKYYRSISEQGRRKGD
jgi:hypothetical protein